jgi:capsular polysaccharide biosynthesis protein
MKTYVTISEILKAVERRMEFFVIPFLIISLMSILFDNVLPNRKRYVSFTSLMIMNEWRLDSGRVVRFATSDNQLASFNETVLSRTTIQTLLDSLGIKPRKGVEVDDLIEATRKKIWTDLRGNDSFRITFVDSDPYLCQRAATVLCNIYIHKSLQSDRQQAEETVRFLEQKEAQLVKKIAEQGSRYVILDPAEVPTTPTKPMKPAIIVWGVVLGIIVGLGAMFLMECYDRTIRFLSTRYRTKSSVSSST